MNTKILVFSLFIIGLSSLFVIINLRKPATNMVGIEEGIPQQVILSGTYECLPLKSGVTTETDCKFGILTEEGLHYAVNFGQSSANMEQFQNKEHITARGFIVAKEALSTDAWMNYTMEGIFTITEMVP